MSAVAVVLAPPPTRARTPRGYGTDRLLDVGRLWVLSVAPEPRRRGGNICTRYVRYHRVVPWLHKARKRLLAQELEQMSEDEQEEVTVTTSHLAPHTLVWERRQKEANRVSETATQDEPGR